MNEEQKQAVECAQKHHDAYWDCVDLKDEVERYGSLGSKGIAHIANLIQVIDALQAENAALKQDLKQADEFLEMPNIDKGELPF